MGPAGANRNGCKAEALPGKDGVPLVPLSCVPWRYRLLSWTALPLLSGGCNVTRRLKEYPCENCFEDGNIIDKIIV